MGVDTARVTMALLKPYGQTGGTREIKQALADEVSRIMEPG
jgi:hypothetical protein